MKRTSIDTQIRRLARRAIARDKTILQVKIDVDILKHLALENTGKLEVLTQRVDVLEQKVDILTQRVDSLAYQMEVLTGKVDLILEGLTEMIRENKESRQLLLRIIPLTEQGDVLKDVVTNHIANRNVHVNMN